MHSHAGFYSTSTGQGDGKHKQRNTGLVRQIQLALIQNLCYYSYKKCKEQILTARVKVNCLMKAKKLLNNLRLGLARDDLALLSCQHPEQSMWCPMYHENQVPTNRGGLWVYFFCIVVRQSITNTNRSRRYVIIANKREVKYLVIVYLFDKEFIYNT